MAIDKYEARKFNAGLILEVKDALTVEQALKINLNKQTFTITMRTPGNDEDLVRGLLYAEDIYRGNEALELHITTNSKKNITEAEVSLSKSVLGEGYLNSRNILSVASCGICGKTELEDLDNSPKIEDNKKLNIERLYGMFEAMKKEQITFHQSGGSHAAAAFSASGEMLSIREDIGRHNAVDKVVGHLLAKKQLKTAQCITVSGRISYEIISKAFAAKIPILAAVSAPSTLAVDFAKELGITLLGFCRDEKATCYAHPERLTQ